jgi:CheY-like chemotaxis protein
MSSGNTVLHAGSNEDDVLIMKAAFEDAGITAHLVAVKSGQEAIACLDGKGEYADRKAFPLPSLFIIDQQLVLKDGLDLLQWLSNHANLREALTVLVISEAEDPLARQRSNALGAAAFLLKPFLYSELVTMVAGWKKYLPESE